MDGVKRVAMVETLTIDGGFAIDTADQINLFRYQLDNHLGSACLELDEAASVISYEEYSPYGSTSYRASKSGIEVSARRYRYTGKEHDEETGLYYYGARYYAAWLGRWTSADPLGLQAGVNLYLYCRAGPVMYVDPDGMQQRAPGQVGSPEEYRQNGREAAAQHAASLEKGRQYIREHGAGFASAATAGLGLAGAIVNYVAPEATKAVGTGAASALWEVNQASQAATDPNLIGAGIIGLADSITTKGIGPTLWGIITTTNRVSRQGKSLLRGR